MPKSAGVLRESENSCYECFLSFLKCQPHSLKLFRRMYAQKQRHYAAEITYTSVADGRESKIRNGLRIAYKSYFKNPSLGKKNWRKEAKKWY